MSKQATLLSTGDLILDVPEADKYFDPSRTILKGRRRGDRTGGDSLYASSGMERIRLLQRAGYRSRQDRGDEERGI